MYRADKLYNYAVEHFKDNEVFPVFIPSYDRPDCSFLTKHEDTNNGLTYILCIREEQLNLYKYWWNKVNILPLRNVHDIADTRQAIIEEASKWYKNIYMFDDKLMELDYLTPSNTANGILSMRAKHLETSESVWLRKVDILKMWQCELEFRKDDNIALSSCSYRPDSWQLKNMDREYVYNSGECIRCIHLNLDLLNKYNIKYKPLEEVGAEDYNLQFQIMSAGLNTLVLTDLEYGMAGTGQQGGCSSTAVQYYGSVENRWKHLTECAKNYYKDHPGIRYTKTRRTGLDTMKFNWKYWRNR